MSAALDLDATKAALQAILAPKARNPRRRDFGDGGFYLDRAPVTVCADGLTFSMQTSFSHYCQPRDSDGPWYSVEIGFPSRRVEEFMPFIAGDDSEPTDTVYGYVPLDVVAAVVVAAGGLAAPTSEGAE